MPSTWEPAVSFASNAWIFLLMIGAFTNALGMIKLAVVLIFILRQFLLTLRIILVTFTAAALVFAVNSRSTMYEMKSASGTSSPASMTSTLGAAAPITCSSSWLP